ncbi:MAG: transposase zinc-binding domain-containing protein [Uliginosibacterium sp.]|nr:transposase zinc-binding domain-containing protein [Uliginosibacterium sp.]
MSARPSLARILNELGPQYLDQHALSSTHAKVWRAITACRTSALGGHRAHCEACGGMRHVYHSCRNRHCPQCQSRAKEAWLAQRRRELLPVPYFHLVFTLPHSLNGLIAQRSRLLFETLFDAAAATLNAFAADPRHPGRQPGLHARATHLEARPGASRPYPCTRGRRRTPRRRHFGAEQAGLPFPGQSPLARVPGASSSPPCSSITAKGPCPPWRKHSGRYCALLHAHDWVVHAEATPGRA